MKKIILFLSLICLFITVAGFISAAEVGGWKLEIGVPGLQAGTEVKEPGQYLETVFKFAVMLAAILAVVMIIAGGFLWMTSPAIGTKEKGKEMIYGAIGGLILLLASYLILYTINPALTGLKGPELADVNINTSGGGGGTGGGGSGGGSGGGGTYTGEWGDLSDLGFDYHHEIPGGNDTVTGEVINNLYAIQNASGEFYITAAHDPPGSHSANSHHYTGQAVDIVPSAGGSSIAGPEWDNLQNAIQQSGVPYLEEGVGTSNHHFHISPDGN